MLGVRALKQTRLGVARIVAGKTFSRLPREVDTGGHGLLGALPRSYAGHPRPATSDTTKKRSGHSGGQPQRESARRPVETFSSASDVTDPTNRNSKPQRAASASGAT